MELYNVSIDDFCSYKKAEIKLYKQGLVWIGGINKDTTAANSNGSGKTTIFKAITWGLYGDTIDKEKGDKIIRNGAKRATVTIKLLENGEKYWTIIRSRTKGSPGLTLINPDGFAVDESKDIIQSKIIDMLGLDFRSFKNTVLYGQNDLFRFAHPSTKDSERKSMLHGILKTDVFEMCYNEIRKINKPLKDEISKIENDIGKLKSNMDLIDVVLLKDKCSKWEEYQNETIKDYISSAKKHKENAISYIKMADEEIEIPNDDYLLKKIKKLEKDAKNIKETEDDLILIDNYIDENNKILNNIKIYIKKLEYQVSECDKQLKLLDGDKCPVCTTSLDGGDAKKHIDDIVENKENALRDFDKSNEEYNKIFDVVCDLNKKKSKIQNKIRDKRDIYNKISSIKSNELYKLQIEINELKHRVDKLKDDAKHEIELAKMDMLNAKKEKERVNPYNEQIDEANLNINKINKNISVFEKQLSEKNNELAHNEFWVKGFSNQGLPSFVLDSVMPLITERANYYLDILSDGDINIEFCTQRELKSSKGTMRDEIEINWSIEGVDGSYPPSGGQLKKLEIATDLALMDLVSNKEGSKLDILMLDEILDGLDDEGCSRVMLLLQKLRKERGSIFVISHENKMSEGFEKSIFAIKESGCTELEF